MSSLQKNRCHRECITTNEDALRWAVKPGVSASFNPGKSNKAYNPSGNSGYGLFIVSEICRLSSGCMTLLSNEDSFHVFPNHSSMIKTNFRGTALGIKIETERIHSYQEIIDRARKQGEETAKTIKNAFKEASVPSKGLLY